MEPLCTFWLVCGNEGHI